MAVAHLEVVLPVSATLDGSGFPAMASLMKNFWAWLVMARASLQGCVFLCRGHLHCRCRIGCTSQLRTHLGRGICAGSGARPAACLTRVMHDHANTLLRLSRLAPRGDHGRAVSPFWPDPMPIWSATLPPPSLAAGVLASWAAPDSAQRGMLPRSLASVPGCTTGLAPAQCSAQLCRPDRAESTITKKNNNEQRAAHRVPTWSATLRHWRPKMSSAAMKRASSSSLHLHRSCHTWAM